MPLGTNNPNLHKKVDLIQKHAKQNKKISGKLGTNTEPETGGRAAITGVGAGTVGCKAATTEAVCWPSTVGAASRNSALSTLSNVRSN